MKKMNPPIPGHELKFEGAIRQHLNHAYVPGCRCGASPPPERRGSKAEVQRWHREHKADLRSSKELT